MTPQRAHAFAALMLTATLCGCAQSRQAPTDEKLTAERIAAMDAVLMQSQQQPRSNPNYNKLVSPQPAEHPLHSGRPIDEGQP